ncbi:MAG: aminotransferase class III-fold pyridoxal phosphate-dependent enzyme [Chloroflexi bacterium]|nr:aminotransferase class III-fold pyridoxal phosphate-dependent enzyme [Chloroflexota bacterium]
METRTSVEEYAARFPKSRALYERAQGSFPRGATHDIRAVDPFPIYVTHASGPYKWDVDGFEYVDYIGGHGALMLGHAHPSLVSAVSEQVARGTHYGASNELEIEWAELIRSMIPSAEQVEFTASENEACMLAVRLARAFTGRDKIVKFRGQSGGWYDHFMVGAREPWDKPTSAGLLAADVANTTAIPFNDEDALVRSLSLRDVAVLMLEPTCGLTGLGIAPSFYKVIREATEYYGTLLLFDEVVSGFRFAPGGAQVLRGIGPDLTALGKIVAGGLPGAGAVVGRKDIMALLGQSDDPEWNRSKRVGHVGTFNANPISAAAGIATLKILATGEPQAVAAQKASLLRAGVRRAMENRGVAGCIYGESSYCQLHFGNCEMEDDCDRSICLNARLARSPKLGHALHIDLVLGGVHTANWGVDLFVSSTHDDVAIAKTVEAFDSAFGRMERDGILKDRRQ